MAAPIVIPFDNNPASTSIKTTSYTIPAGKYAKVKGWFINTGTGTAATYTMRTLTIDGVAVHYDNSFIVTRNAFTGTAGSVMFTVPQPFSGVMTFNYYNGGTAAIGSISFDGGASPKYALLTNVTSGIAIGPTDFMMEGGSAIYTSGSSGSLNQYMRLAFKNEMFPEYFEAWVPSGTVLSGNTASSFNWFVEEYNVIS